MSEIEFKTYTDCSQCGYRKWCKIIQNKPVCSACEIHGPNPRFIKPKYK